MFNGNWIKEERKQKYLASILIYMYLYKSKEEILIIIRVLTSPTSQTIVTGIYPVKLGLFY